MIADRRADLRHRLVNLFYLPLNPCLEKEKP